MDWKKEQKERASLKISLFKKIFSVFIHTSFIPWFICACVMNVQHFGWYMMQ